MKTSHSKHFDQLIFLAPQTCKKSQTDDFEINLKNTNLIRHKKNRKLFNMSQI